MEISDPIAVSSSPNIAFSPDGNLLAVVHRLSLLIRDVESLCVKSMHKALDVINAIQWSPDGNV